MNSFDISKVVKTDDWQPSITTRNGKRVKLHVFDVPSFYPIIGFVEGCDWNKGDEIVWFWNRNGKRTTPTTKEEPEFLNDIIIVEPRHELWMELPGVAGVYNLLVTPNPKDLLDGDKPQIKITYQGDEPVGVELVKE